MKTNGTRVLVEEDVLDWDWAVSLAGAPVGSGEASAEAALTGAGLTDAGLTDAGSAGPELTGPELTGAQLAGAELTGAELTGPELAALCATQRDLADSEGGIESGDDWGLAAEVDAFLAHSGGWVDPGQELAGGLGLVGRGLDRVGALGAPGLVRVLDDGLVGALGEAGALRAELTGAVVSLAVEANSRGLHNQVGLSLVNWLVAHCDWLSKDEACQVQAVVRAGETYWGKPLARAVIEGATGLHRGAQVARTIRRLEPGLSAEQAIDYAQIATDAASNPQISDADLGKVCHKLLIDLLDEKPREAIKDTANAMRRVTSRALGKGMRRFTIDAPEAEATLIDGVLTGPLAAPSATTPLSEDGTSGGMDMRSAGQRKFDALFMVLNRGMSNPGAPPSSGRASVMVTVKADPLTGKPVGAAFTNTGAVLDAGQAGRFACIGDVTPIVLGEHGEPLDLGRTVRLATAGQFKALMVRDGQCTYPGCDVPGTWCDAHHIIWWCRGGTTDIAYLVLLCPRHHTVVHDKDLEASVVGSVVTWHV